jgi:Class III cytochrome C family
MSGVSMTDPRKEKTVAYYLAGILLLVAVVCYAAYPTPAPKVPIRIVLKNIAGNVLFDHKEHTSAQGIGLKCTECHHDIDKEGQKPSPCEECHKAQEGEGEGPLLSDAFHKQCRGCHEDGGQGPVNCSACHVLL